MLVRSLILLCLLLSAGFVATGQVSEIDKSEFRALIEIGYSNLKGVSYRKNYLEEKLDSTGRVVSTNEYYIEKLPPDRARRVSLTSDGGKTSTYETITIGSHVYQRRDKGEWTAVSGQGSGYGMAAPITFESFKRLRDEKVSGAKTKVYEHIEKVRMASARGPYEEISTTRYWIDKRGRILKETLDREDTLMKQIFRTTTTYDYKVKINIDEPRISTTR